MAKLTYITLFVEKLDATRNWYTELLGLTVAWQSEDFVLLNGGGLQLGLHRGDALNYPHKVQIHFYVKDLDAAYRSLRDRGVRFRLAPHDTPWGKRVAVLHDPTGHTVELYTPQA